MRDKQRMVVGATARRASAFTGDRHFSRGAEAFDSALSCMTCPVKFVYLLIHSPGPCSAGVAVTRLKNSDRKRSSRVKRRLPIDKLRANAWAYAAQF